MDGKGPRPISRRRARAEVGALILVGVVTLMLIIALYRPEQTASGGVRAILMYLLIVPLLLLAIVILTWSAVRPLRDDVQLTAKQEVALQELLAAYGAIGGALGGAIGSVGAGRGCLFPLFSAAGMAGGAGGGRQTVALCHTIAYRQLGTVSVPLAYLQDHLPDLRKRMLAREFEPLSHNEQGATYSWLLTDTAWSRQPTLLSLNFREVNAGQSEITAFAAAKEVSRSGQSARGAVRKFFAEADRLAQEWQPVQV